MERLQPAVYDGANYVAGQTKEHLQLEEASQKDLSEELHGAEERIQLFDDFFARIHQEAETANDLQRICEEVHGSEAEEIDLEKAEARNDQIRDELLAKAYVEKELENAHEEIRILEKKLERVTGDLETANEKLLEKSDLEEYVETLESELNAAVEEVYRIGTKLDTVMDENSKLKVELSVKKDVVCDLEMAEEEL
ncbi:tropomyosin-like [Palaemon carinicauda]|uniref:tropomyosin-like n=1 Tax=Palaemon carinicauda TaxID=392227 RepID=UPI0035B6696E